jgi:hypothetical protein
MERSEVNLKPSLLIEEHRSGLMHSKYLDQACKWYSLFCMNVIQLWLCMPSREGNAILFCFDGIFV